MLSFLDNGLTLEQQEHADNVYETLMSDLKTINVKLYQTLRAKELTEKDKDDLRKLYKKAVMTGWLVQEDLEKSAEEKNKE